MAFVVKDAVREPLYAIVPYFNPWRWKSREKHTLRAIKHFMDSGAVVILVEVAFNRREFTWADSGLDGTPAVCNVLGERKFLHRYIPLRSKEELWLKENSINVAIARALPFDWQQVCWLDSDIHFIRPNWVGETIHKLQHYSWLQMFSHARDVGPDYEMLNEDYPHANGIGFVQAHENGTLEESISGNSRIQRDLLQVGKDIQKLVKDFAQLEEDIHEYGPGAPKRVWPGLAWACTREAFEQAGGLLDFAIWGGGDWHMANALVNRTHGMMRNDLHSNYKQKVLAWHEKVTHFTSTRLNVGVMSGSIIHNWHGRKTERGYNEKHALLAKLGFDPIAHLKRDHQGLYQLHDDGSQAYTMMRDEMRRIALERNEDSIDL